MLQATQPDQNAWLESIQQLLEIGQGQHALLTAQHALREWSHPAQVEELRHLLELLSSFPSQQKATNEWLRLCLAVQEQVRYPYQQRHAAAAYQVHKEARNDIPPFQQVYWAWALVRAEYFEKAEQWAEALVKSDLVMLSTEEQILLWRTLGRTRHHKQEAEWPQAFAQAIALAGDSRLAGIVYMEMGIIWSYERNEVQAIQCFAQAEPFLRRTALADWPVQSVGFLHLQTGNLKQAEANLIRIMNPNSPRYSRTLSGLAGVRRAYGEWPRALHLYREAAAVAEAHKDIDNLRHALRGEGHTLRLSGEPLAALEPLVKAANCMAADKEVGQSWVYADIAAAQASLPVVEVSVVEASLKQFSSTSDEDKGRVEIVRAEMLRRRGHTAQARAKLQSLRQDALWFREEAYGFPQLFALLPELPKPLPRNFPMTVRLEAVGHPAVYVCGRRVEASPKALVVLASLLLAGGRQSSEQLGETLREEVPANGSPPSRRTMQQRTSKAVSQLRTALGWPDSVCSTRGSYTLDEATFWQCDAVELQTAGQSVPEFMAGIYLPWTQDQAERLSVSQSEKFP